MMKNILRIVFFVLIFFIISGCGKLNDAKIEDVYEPVSQAIEKAFMEENINIIGEIYFKKEVLGNFKIGFGKDETIYEYELSNLGKKSIYYSSNYGILYEEAYDSYRIVHQNDIPFIKNLNQILPNKDLLSNLKKRKTKYYYSISKDIIKDELLLLEPLSENVDFIVSIEEGKIVYIEYSFKAKYNNQTDILKITMNIEKDITKQKIPTVFEKKIGIYENHMDLLDIIKNSLDVDYFYSEIKATGKHVNYLIQLDVDNKNNEAIINIDDEKFYYKDDKVYFKEDEVGGFSASNFATEIALYIPDFVPIDFFTAKDYRKIGNIFSFELDSNVINSFSNSFIFSKIDENIQITSAKVIVEISNDYLSSLKVVLVDENFEESTIDFNFTSLNNLKIDFPDFSNYIDVDAEISKFNYILKEDKTIKIISINKDVKSLFIPRKINDYIINEIGQNAFSGIEITDVILPKSMEIIGERAFAGSSINKLFIPNNVRIIKELGELNSLIEINVDLDNKDYRVVNGALVNNNNELLIYPAKSPVEELVIPKEIIKIGDNAFSNSEYLKSIIFESGSNLETIGENAFNFSRINNIVLPEGLKYINANAFRNCDELRILEVPKSVIEIGSQAFYYMSALKEVKLPFVGMNNLSSLEIEFSYENSLNYVLDNRDLELLTIYNMSLIPTKSFVNAKLKKLVIENTLEIAPSAFSDSSIEELYISKEIIKLHMLVFNNAKINKMSLPFVGSKSIGLDEEEYIENTNFNYYFGNRMDESETIEELTIYGDYNIEHEAFYETYIKQINITGNIRSIGASAFARSPITEVIRITNAFNLEINKEAFSYMPTLKTIEVNGELSMLGKDLFIKSDNIEFEKHGILYYLGNWVIGYEKTSRFPWNERIELESLGFKENTIGFYYSALEKFSRYYSYQNEIHLPSRVEYILDNAFLEVQNVINLEQLTSLTYIGEQALYSNAQTTGFIPESVTYVGQLNFESYQEVIINNMPKFILNGDIIRAERILVPSEIYEEFINKYPEFKTKVYVNQGYTISNIQYIDGMDIKLTYRILDIEGGVKILYLLDKLTYFYSQFSIPEELDNKSVIELGSRSFNIHFNKLIVGDSVKRIEKEAFTQVICSSIYIGSNVEYIGEDVFRYVNELSIPFIGSGISSNKDEERKLSWFFSLKDNINDVITLTLRGGSIWSDSLDLFPHIYLYLENSVNVEEGALDKENIIYYQYIK